MSFYLYARDNSNVTNDQILSFPTCEARDNFQALNGNFWFGRLLALIDRPNIVKGSTIELYGIGIFRKIHDLEFRYLIDNQELVKTQYELYERVID